MEVTGWALIPIVLASALLLLGYWWMFRLGRRLLGRGLARIEQRHHVSIAYNHRSIKLVGKLKAWQRVKLEIMVLLLHIVAYLAPLVIIGCVVMATGGFLESLVVRMMAK